MALPANFLRSANPFQLADPPKWFMVHMKAFDPLLVMFASEKDPVFKLARRCKFSAGVKPADVPGVANHPDTIFMFNRRIVPVTTVIPKAHWGLHVFEQLAARDIVRRGGHKRVVSEMEASERAAREKAELDRDDLGTVVGSDAYASLKYRTGQRVSMAYKGSPVNKNVKPLFFGPSGKPLVFNKERTVAGNLGPDESAVVGGGWWLSPQEAAEPAQHHDNAANARGDGQSRHPVTRK
jgi:hypothetical protein